MKINVNAELRCGRSSVEAQSHALSLTNHGIDEQESLESLRRGILAWSLSLDSLGSLEMALKRRQVKCQPDGDSISVEVNPIWVNESS